MEIILFSEMMIPKDTSAISLLILGFVLGLWHAKDPDHLAAVSTIVSERKSLLSSTIIGGFWGIGHTISLLIVGILVIFLKLQISEKVEGYLEAGVGIMLVLLGLNALRKVFQSEKIHLHQHQHNGREHLHLHTHADEKAEENHHFLKFSPRAVLVGMIHGLAGSAAVMLLIIPTISSPVLALGYVLIFGIGSIGGMMIMSFMIGLPFHFTADKFLQFNKVIKVIAGIFSFGLGLFIIYEKIFA